MKRSIFYLCMVIFLPSLTHAQISTSIAQKYSLWTVVKAFQCNYMSSGPEGSARTWNFSGLTPLNVNDTATMHYIASTSSMLYPGASRVRKFGNEFTFYDYQSDGVYILGGIDNSNSPPDTQMYDNPKRIMMHPMTYLNKYTDSFEINAGKADSVMGTIVDTVESFGKLILPNDTFENVIRMKFTEEADGVFGGNAGHMTHVSYQWYDITNSSPLLQIDSSVVPSGSGTVTIKTTFYLLKEDPVYVSDIATDKLHISAIITGNNILLTGGTEQGHRYYLALHDLAGRKLFSTTFTGNGRQLLNTTQNIIPGLYVLVVQDRDEPSKAGVLKITKRQ